MARSDIGDALVSLIIRIVGKRGGLLRLSRPRRPNLPPKLTLTGGSWRFELRKRVVTEIPIWRAVNRKVSISLPFRESIAAARQRGAFLAKQGTVNKGVVLKSFQVSSLGEALGS